MIERHQERVDDGDARNYIGASSIGSDCLRQIWYQYKGVKAEAVPAKFRRTWAIGKKLEGLILDWLESTGLTIVRLWWDLKSENVPFFKGHVDSVWTKKEVPYEIIEVKTAKDASFKIFVKKGVKVWNPQYYAQIQSYMGMSGIHSTYILVLNKDNSDLSDELVEFDPTYYVNLECKALMISNAKVEPPRINGSPLFFKCKMCKFNKVCHK
jgi:hypothetical protein